MNDALKLQISAFVDGELPDNESELLLRRLSQDAELRARAASYLSIGRAIRGELEPAGLSGLRNRIAAALGEEIATPAPVPKLVPSRFMRPVVGVAVAASVAVMALIGLRQVGPSNELPTADYSDLAALAIDEAPAYTEPPADETLSNRPSEMQVIYDRRHRAQSGDFSSVLVSFEQRDEALESAATPDDSEQDEAPESPGGAAENTATGTGQ